MQTSSTRAPGMLARLRGRLRGDRYMVDAYRTAPVDREPGPARAPTVPAKPTAKER